VRWIRKAGFENLNLDLIFGIPNQSLRSWQRTLELAVSLNPDHLSLYGLSIENGTPLGDWVGNGLLLEPDQDLSAQMYEWASEELITQGYKQYEISNWARRDPAGNLLVCQHNLQYWRNLPYLGIGAGGHGFAGGCRTENERSPQEYIREITACRDQQFIFPRTPATVACHPVSREQEMRETMLMGLRLTIEGVSNKVFRSRFGCDLEETFRDEIDRSVRSGLLEWVPGIEGGVRLTPRGRLLGNQVFVQFV
jgi:oxygen-independent coproporphyrinogen-3 oxidase